MSIFEYDKEKEEKKLREAEFEYGREEGIKEGTHLALRTTALNLMKMQLPLEQIAIAVGESMETVKKWVEEDL